MSYKEDLKQGISKDTMIENLEIVYKKALEESKITGESISSIIYQILETIEDNHNKEIDRQLTQSSKIVIKIIYEDAKKNIEKREKKLVYAYLKLIDTVESEILHLLESIETLDSYANDQSHIEYKRSLSHIKSDIIDKVNKFEMLLSHYINH